MSATKHFRHVSAELRARHLGTYLGHADRADGVPRPGRYELWRSPEGILQWRGPSHPAELLWTDPLPGETTTGDALVDLWRTLGQPPSGDATWHAATVQARRSA